MHTRDDVAVRYDGQRRALSMTRHGSRLAKVHLRSRSRSKFRSRVVLSRSKI